MIETAPQYLRRKGKPSLAFVYSPGRDETAPLTVFCGGYRSDMSGTKATYLEQACRNNEHSFLRFDYSGHGESNGRFEDGLVGYWLEDAADVIGHIAGSRRIVLIGSSMGGWIALLLAKRWPEKLAGLIGIAAAPDFTRDIYEHHLTASQRAQLEAKGYLRIPNDYSDEPYQFTKAFFEDGAQHSVMQEEIVLSCPVRLFQGGQDKDVLPATAYAIEAQISGPDTQVILIEDGDHRLSRPQDLALIEQTILRMLQKT